MDALRDEDRKERESRYFAAKHKKDYPDAKFAADKLEWCLEAKFAVRKYCEKCDNWSDNLLRGGDRECDRNHDEPVVFAQPDLVAQPDVAAQPNVLV